MSILEKVGSLKEFARQPATVVEKELIAVLKNRDSGGRLEHLGETVLDRLRSLVAETEKSFEQRTVETQVVAAGFVSGVSVLLLGPPGTAKSALVRRIASLCGLAPGQSSADLGGGGYFEYLLTNHTMPEDLFGALDLKNLAEGRLTRVTTGKLPTAEIAFLDEVFRGGGHILNTLLTIINEKRYDSGGGSVHVPLLGLVAAANYAKLDMELEAFFDRFPIRVWVRSVFEQERRSYTARIPAGVSSRLVRFEVQNEISRLLGAWAAPENSAKELDTARLSCTNDFRFARIYLLCKMQEMPEDSKRFQEFEAMFRMVRERVNLSDRAFGQLWLFAGALDLILGKPVDQAWPAGQGHYRVFQHLARTAADSAFLRERYEQQTRGTEHARDV